MSNLTIEIKANELTEAILALANALSGYEVQAQQDTVIAPFIPPVQQVQQVQQQPVQQPIQQPVQQPVQQIPVQQATYSTEQLAIAATQLVDAGKRNDLVQLLQSFGVGALTQLPKERYGEFATQIRAMGAKL